MLHIESTYDRWSADIFDGGGHLVATFTGSDCIDLTFLPTGTYFLRVRTKGGTAGTKLIKR
ncbi:T9SS type A sorting domain-containing protein [Flavobacterium sp. N1718]|uniref:T9SS type A sorting domain-containing protein n=1 Tax=Flavobacterium sp. N1718 TaxID=2986822 RepID=UPI0039B4B76A